MSDEYDNSSSDSLHHAMPVDSYESDGHDMPVNRYNPHSNGGSSQLPIDEESGDEVHPLRDSSTSSARTVTPNTIATDTGTMGPPPLPSTAHGSGGSTPATASPHSANFPHNRSRGGSNNTLNHIDTALSNGNGSQSTSARPARPIATRTPSHAYAPPRRPSQFAMSAAGKHRSSSGSRTARMNPDADYRAQKKLYVQRLQQDNAEEMNMISSDEYTPSLGYSETSSTEDESPNTNDYVENDPYDQETMLYYENGETLPSMEEMMIPENRERLEWHSMLASVLTGDVVKQEKRRLIGATDQPGDDSLKSEVWLGVRARVCGRTIPAQKRMLEDQRSRISTTIEEIVLFEIKGETEVGKGPRQQVDDIVNRIGKLESLYPTRQALETAHPRAASEDFQSSCEALVSWHNTTELINTELGVLQAWVGNEELDFSKNKGEENDHLSDGSTFIERILKEDGLKSLQGKTSMLHGVGQVIKKAKQTLIENHSAFVKKHLPPYIEELLILINFPSRLVQEIIRMRMSYATKMKDQAQQGTMITEQMISQFQILLNLAVRIKNNYLLISQPQSGWDLPPCIDENFDAVVLEALRFYFKMLNWKLSANKNTFKEADFLEQEWGFCTQLGRHFVGGDVEVAEQFSSLTSKSLYRLTTHFEKELQRRPDEIAGAEMDKRYKQILDSVRVRQRKLFRFSRLLSQTFENAVDYDVSSAMVDVERLIGILLTTGHILVNPVSDGQDNVFIFASISLQDRPRDIVTLLGTAYRAEAADPSEPYALILCTELPVAWEGPSVDVEMLMPKVDLKPGKLRLLAEGAQTLLQNAKDNFLATIGTELDVVVAQRANLSSVDKELQRIRRIAYKLSNTIMDSVGIIRKQLAGLECHELIQNCFAFATEFGQRSLMYMDHSRRALNNLRLTRLALDWVSFICDDCIASERRTFRWAVVALEFAMVMTRGQNIISISDEEYATLRAKTSGCMSLLISHFDIMGARSTVAAQAEKQRFIASVGGGKFKLDISKLKDDEESVRIVREQWMEQLLTIDDMRKGREAESKPLGRVLEGSTEADRSLTWLSASATNVTIRWQQGQYIGGGTFGSVYVATNIDSGHLMAVKEIRLQDPQMIPTIVGQIRDEMSVLQILTHPNIVDYHGIEVHRDKVYIFMEYCSGGSLATLLEHGRIEDETVITVYALQMLEGLAYLHESGVIHRDIKPENILLDHNGVIKYVDFGAAKIIARQSGRTLAHPGDQPSAPAPERRQGRQKSMTGTPMYMSPEVIRGNSAIPNTPSSASSSSTSSSSTTNPSSPQSPPSSARPGAADTWSLGCVILEMATGRRPWASLDNEWAIMYNIAQGNAPALPTRDQLSEPGIEFLKKCFERDPVKRASAAELLQSSWIMALRNMLNLEPGSASGSGTPSSASREGSEMGGSSQPPSRQNTSSFGSGG